MAILCLVYVIIFPDEDIYELVDGYHRYCVLKTSKRVFEREKGLLPVVVIEKTFQTEWQALSATTAPAAPHSIELMVDIVAELTKAGMSDEALESCGPIATRLTFSNT